MGRTKLYCLRKIQLFVKFSQLLMYLFISAWSGVRFLNPTGRPHHAMQREIIIFLYTFWTVRRVVGRNTSWMKNQREPSDGKEATREHGNCVSIFSAFSFTFKCCFPPHVTCYWEGCGFFFLQGGSEGGWIRLPQSLRWGDSFPIQKEKVSMFIHAKSWDMVLLQHWKFPLMCCWVFFLIPFSVAALPYRCSKSLACLLFKIS